MLLVETGLVLLSVLLAFAYPSLGAPWFEEIERKFSALSRLRTLSVTLVGLTALGIRAALLPVEPIPDPGVHDEFSYLLMADTFAHGRLSNPTHPMWQHFETFHVIQKPSYASMYYPAQGLFLAFGQVFFGHPFWGVWLSAGLMCGAICWMLQGWFSPFWALLGASLVLIRLGTFSYWVDSYFGGCVAALGGAFVLGALPRVKKNPRWPCGVIMGIGLGLLATSRPYEGLFFSLPILCVLLLWTFRRRGSDLRVLLKQVFLPAAAVLCLVAGFTLFYFWKVTGNPFRAPFFVNLATYDPVPYFPWQTVKNWPSYHHDIMRRFYEDRLRENYQLGREHPLINTIIKTDLFGFFYLGPLFAVLILMLGIVLPLDFSFDDVSRRTRFLFLIAGAAMAGESLPVFYSAHYAAPVVCVLYALIITSMQCIRKWEWHRKATGLALVRFAVATTVLLFFICLATPILHIPNSPVPQTWCSPYKQGWDRPTILARIERLPGRHLVLVRYGPNHDPRSSWVSNGADIDGSKVVWANDMGADKNKELIEYFKDRKIWLLETDASPTRISPYADTSLRP